MNANEFLRNKSVYRLDTRPSPRVRGSGFARLIMAKAATNPKTSMQREGYCLAVHKNTHERTSEYWGAEKRTAEKSDFVIFFLTQN